MNTERRHPSVTLHRVVEAAARDKVWPGFCLSCGMEQDVAHPDEKDEVCDTCGEKAVFGCDAALATILGAS